VVAYDANSCTDTSDAITVTVYQQPNVDLGRDTVLCETDSIFLDAGPFPSTNWSWGLTAQTYWVTFSGTYVVEVTDANGCNDIDSIEVNYFLPPVVDLGSDLVICPDDVYTLDAGSGYNAYDWNNSATGQYLDAGPGYYRVTVTDVNGCQGISNLLYIEGFPQTPVPVIAGDASGLAATTSANYQWYFNGNPITGATSQSYDPDSSGSYYVEVTDTNGCGTEVSNTIQIEIIEELTAADIPEGFSPNGDGINDNFQIRNLDLFPQNNLKVFGRWGQIVFERAPYTGDFNGNSDNGSALPDGTYIYILDLANGQDPFSGTLIINR
jgi:gliding motility-associated-like protein